MRIIDISQEVLSSNVYPGDPTPQAVQYSSISNGDLYNLSGFSMCAHNGTHVDAPSHFIANGKAVDQLHLDAFVGKCYVAHYDSDLYGQGAAGILELARNAGAEERILIAGNVTVTAEAARVFANSGIKLLGNCGQTVGPKDAPMEVHQILLGAGVALLEGIVLQDVEEKSYWLSAAPLNIAGFEGAPCRAYLIEQ